MKSQSRGKSSKVREGSMVVGVFEERRQADRAIADLRSAGFSDDQIGIVMRSGENEFTVGGDRPSNESSQVSEGATSGALAGLGLGALAGMGVLAGMIPVVGPAIAGGTLGVILSNAAAGAGIAGLVGALVGAGIPEEEAHYYQEEFEAGRAIVTVQAGDRTGEAEAILSRDGAYNVNSRGTPRPITTTNLEASNDRFEGDMVNRDTADYPQVNPSDTIQVKEEELQARKHAVEKGEVRLRKEVRTEKKTIEVPVDREEIVIERKPVRKNAASSDFREGEEIRIPVREEQVEVNKTPVVTEEVKVGKRTVHDTEKVSGEVRKERVQVDRKGDVDIHSPGSSKGRKSS